MTSRVLSTVVVLVCSFHLSGAQTPAKKTLDHGVYDGWKRVAGQSISRDGKWVVYTVEPQEGDPQLVLYNTAARSYDTIPRGTGARISESSDFVLFAIKPPFAEVKKMKIAKKKEADLPKDSLGLYELASGSLTKIARVKSFKLPEKGTGWVAYQLEQEPADTSKKARKKPSDDTEDQDEDTPKKEEPGTSVILRNLVMKKEYAFPFASEYVFSKNGKRFLVATTGNDSTVLPGVFTMNTGKALSDTSRSFIDTLAKGKGKYKNIACDDDGLQAAFAADRDTSKGKQRYYSLLYWSETGKKTETIADTLTPGLPKGWLISEHAGVSFSRDGKKIMFGTAPVPSPEDTTMNDQETAKLDVWNWQDPHLQPMQLKNLSEEKKRSYLAVIHLKNRRFTQLAALDRPSIVTGMGGNTETALGLSDLPYRKLVSWDGLYRDVFVVDMLTGSAKKIMTKVRGNPALSPSGRYVVWYAEEDSNWYSYSIAGGRTVRLTGSVPFPLYYELNDVPDKPRSYGLMAWTQDDKDVMIYDRYDIWRLDPDGKRPPASVTQGSGRKENIVFRYVKLDPDEEYLRSDAEILLEAFSNTDKSSGFSRVKLSGGKAPEKLFMGPFDFSTPVKSRDTEMMILTRSNFRECPDLFTTDRSMSKLDRISNVNPQQSEYSWGSVELITWIAADGLPIEGLLYKPEDFDPKKKYPLLSYFYERNSDNLNRYYPPSPPSSSINISLYVSNGYVVFVPDIRYQVGYPGKSAYDCVVPGILSLIRAGFIDSSKIGIQGHSWGGYQVTYLVSRSKMFAAAEAGAPVSNMTSAYGGIRWESGMSRMFQYEKTQSRIGATLWENPTLYLENSALFKAPDITTPLLMLHNDADGAVPWYQGIELFVALRRLNKPVWMVNYNGEPHGIRQRKNQKDWAIRMMQFFDHYLKGKPAPAWMAEGIPAVEKGKTLGY